MVRYLLPPPPCPGVGCPRGGLLQAPRKRQRNGGSLKGSKNQGMHNFELQRETMHILTGRIRFAHG